MVATTMIGNVSAVPPEARHAKRLLGLLGGGGKTPALAGRALLSAVAAVDVTLPPNPSVDGRGDGDCGGDGGGEDAAVMEAVRAALERRRGGSAAAAGPGPVPAPAEDPLRLRASSAAAATLRDGLARAVRSLVEADERARAAGEKGRERIEERLGMALWRGIGRAVDAGTAVLGGEGDPDAPSDEEGDGGSGGTDAAAPKRKGRGGDGESSGGSKRPRTAGGGTGDPPATAPGEGWERTAAIRRTASHCLEALHLEVASRSPRVWGRRKIYEVYCMPRPVRTVGRGDGALKSVRDAVEREFRSSFHGGGEDQSGVRVYVLLRRVVPKLWGKEAKGSRGDLGGEGADPNGEEEDSAGTYLFVHLCIGKPLDMNDESNRSRSGEKKKKMGNEFVAIMRPGSTLFALTASRAPSRSYRTPFVLAALVTALGSNAGDCLGRELCLFILQVGSLCTCLSSSPASVISSNAPVRFSFPPFPFPIFLSLKTRRSGSGTARELSPSSYLRLPRRQPTVRLSVGSPATPSGASVDGGARTQAGQRWATRWLRSIAPPPTPSWEGRRRGEGSRLVSDAIIYLSRRTPWLIVLWPSVFGL